MPNFYCSSPFHRPVFNRGRECPSSRQAGRLVAAAFSAAILLSISITPAHAGTVHWRNPGGGLWNVAANWDTNSKPQSNDDVINDLLDALITLNSSETFGSFVSRSAFTINGGSLTGSRANQASTIQVNNTFMVNNGGLTNLTINAGSGGQGVTFTGNNTISNVIFNANTSFLAGSSTDVLNAKNVIDNGAATFSGGHLRLRHDTGGALTIGSLGVVQGFGTLDQSANFTTLTNNGTINANTSGQTLRIVSSNINGIGTFMAGGGILSIGGTLNGTNIQINAPDDAANGYVLIKGGTLSGSVLSTTGTGFTFTGAADNNSLNNVVINGNVMFTGGAADVFNAGSAVNGTLILNGTSLRLRHDASGTLTINPGARLLGYGTIYQSADFTTLTNNGTINANTSGQTLRIASCNINGSGLFAASNGGVLSIGGTLTGNNASVEANTGTIQVRNGALSGSFASSTGTGFTFMGAADNNSLNNVVINGNVMFTGGAADVFNAGSAVNGTLILNGTSLRLRHDASGTLTINPGARLLGYGTIYQSADFTTLTNNGTINANTSGPALRLVSNGINGAGTFEATQNGILSIGGTLTGKDAVIHADTGSVQVQDGTLAGTFSAATGTGFTFISSSVNAYNNSLNNAVVNGNLTFGSHASVDVLNAKNVIDNGAATFSGGHLRLRHDTGGALTIGSLGVVQGYGTLDQSANFTTLTNNGTINANTSGQTLTIGPSNFANTGTVKTAAGATLTVNSATTNTGTINAAASSTILLNAGATQTAGSTTVDGTLNTNNQSFNLQGGTLGGAGTIVGPINNMGGALSPGDSPGTLTLTGNYTQGSAASMFIELGGNQQGQTYDLFKISGSATLGGTLKVTLVNGYRPGLDRTFDFMTYGSRINNSVFSNVLPQNGGYQYTISYGAKIATLRVAAVPEPTTFVALGGLFSLFGFARFRARRCAT